MKKLKQMYRCMEEWMYGKSKDKAVSIPPYLNSSIPRRSGFTLVELVITIAIVIILSVISVPIYRGYIDKAKMSEGYALLGAIISAQKSYYSEYGYFLSTTNSVGCQNFSGYDPVLRIDARGNRYFTLFRAGATTEFDKLKYMFVCPVRKNAELASINGKWNIWLLFNITTGAYYWEEN